MKEMRDFLKCRFHYLLMVLICSSKSNKLSTSRYGNPARRFTALLRPQNLPCGLKATDKVFNNIYNVFCMYFNFLSVLVIVNETVITIGKIKSKIKIRASMYCSVLQKISEKILQNITK